MAFVSAARLLRGRGCQVAASPAFSTSQPGFVDFRRIFRKKGAANQTDGPQLEPTEKDLMRLEVKTSQLGLQEKATLRGIIDKGFGKVETAYEPSGDVGERMKAIYWVVFGQLQNATNPLETLFDSRATKFQFLTACEKAFSHPVTNSRLYEMTTVGDVLDFYLQPVHGTNGLTQYQRMDNLPGNLHISYQPHRFDPDNDPIYGGITAFPHASNKVTSLKYKKIYKSRKAETNWPKVLDCAPFHRNLPIGTFIKRR